MQAIRWSASTREETSIGDPIFGKTDGVEGGEAIVLAV